MKKSCVLFVILTAWVWDLQCQIPLISDDLGDNVPGSENSIYFAPMPPNQSSIDNSKIHIVFIGDGYVDNSTFKTHVEQNYLYLAQQAPFNAYLNYFKFYAVNCSTSIDGIEHPDISYLFDNNCDITTTPVSPCGEPPVINTQANYDLASTQTLSPLHSSLDNFNAHRGLASDLALVNQFVDLRFGTSNQLVFPVVIVNTKLPRADILGFKYEYAGTANIPENICFVAGFQNVFTSIPNGASLVHELGHSFGLLQDEYYFECPDCFFDCQSLSNAPNRYYNSAFVNPPDALLHWEHWIRPGVPVQDPPISNYNFTENYSCPTSATPPQSNHRRPTVGAVCKMEYLSEPFCAVCREAIIERIHTLVNPVIAQAPDNSQILPASSSLAFEVNLTVPNPNTMRVQWELVNSQGQTQLLETDYNGAGDQNGINGNGGGAPSGVYRWHFECEKFNVSGFTEPGIYKVRAKIFDMTGNSEGASNRWVRHPNHEIDTNDPNDLNHERIVEWQVEYNGYSGIDLYVSDLPNDLGTEPSTASDILWQSPDIWLCNTNNSNCAAPGEAVSYNGTGSEAQVRFNVKNRGCKVYEPTDNGSANVYWAKAGTGLEWPTSWNGNTFGNGALQGDFIANIPLNTVIDKNNPNGVTFTANWTLQDPSNYASIANYNDDVQHFCMLVALNSTSDAYQMVSNVAWPLFHNVKMSNNVAWKNLSIIDVSGNSALGETTSTDVIRGGEIIVGNNTNQTKSIKLAFEIPSTEVGNPITAEAEVRVTLHSSLWSAWMSGGQLGNNIQVHDASKRQIRILNSPATLSGISMAPNAHYGVYVSVNYLTQQRSSKEFFALRLSQIADDSTQKIVGGETYLFRADPNRNLFTANGGGDVEVLVGQAFQNKGNSIGENALFNWYNQQGARIYTGSIRSDSASTAGSEQFTLEVISATDGYKDYDQITVHRILGKITSMVPNPINSGTLAIGYKVSSAVSSPKIRLIHINTQTYTEHSISNGTGTLNVNVAGYASGAYSVVLIDGNSQSMDDELLVIQ